MVTYLSDVKFLKRCAPAEIERNAEEYLRLCQLLESVLPDLNRAKEQVVWKSASRESYEARVKEAQELVSGLFEGFEKARKALLFYADEVEAARVHYEEGVYALDLLRSLAAAEDSLATPIFRAPVTVGSERTDPMRLWEDLRPVLGEVPILGTRCERAYHAASEAFGRAKKTEEYARTTCQSELRTAYGMLPDFRGGNFADNWKALEHVPALEDAVARAQGSPYVKLPGSGIKEDVWPSDGPVSPKLAALQAAAAQTHTTDKSMYQDWGGFEEDWIRQNSELFTAAGAATGLPPDFIAGIMSKETDKLVRDDGVELARRMGILDGAPDETSFGPMQIQIRRGAEVLGYDPENLTEDQRDAIRGALRDPATSVFIAAEFAKGLKEESTFADTPAHMMGRDQYIELAARYNSTPEGYTGHDPQEYGKDVADYAGKVKNAFQ